MTSKETPNVVYIVDDDAAVRSSLSSLLRSVGYEPRTYESAAQFLEDDLADAPACLITDVRLPGSSGLELQRRLNELDVGIPVVLVTGYGDIEMSVKAMKAGAVDFLTKPFRAGDLLEAVDVAVNRDRERRLENQSLVQMRTLYRTLSAREQQVMAEVVAGKLNKQIADELSITEATVKVHRAAVMRKMAATSLAELVRMAQTFALGA